MIDWIRGVDFGAILQALLPATSLLLGAGKVFRRSDTIRARITTDLQILNSLPKNSRSHATMLKLIDDQISDLAGEDNARRDIPMFVVSLIAAPGLIYLAVFLARQQTWLGWTVGTAVGLLGILFTYGVFETGARVPRDDKGMRIRK